MVDCVLTCTKVLSSLGALLHVGLGWLVVWCWCMFVFFVCLLVLWFFCCSFGRVTNVLNMLVFQYVCLFGGFVLPFLGFRCLFLFWWGLFGGCFSFGRLRAKWGGLDSFIFWFFFWLFCLYVLVLYSLARNNSQKTDKTNIQKAQMQKEPHFHFFAISAILLTNSVPTCLGRALKCICWNHDENCGFSKNKNMTKNSPTNWVNIWSKLGSISGPSMLRKIIGPDTVSRIGLSWDTLFGMLCKMSFTLQKEEMFNKSTNKTCTIYWLKERKIGPDTDSTPLLFYRIMYIIHCSYTVYALYILYVCVVYTQIYGWCITSWARPTLEKPFSSVFLKRCKNVSSELVDHHPCFIDDSSFARLYILALFSLLIWRETSLNFFRYAYDVGVKNRQTLKHDLVSK